MDLWLPGCRQITLLPWTGWQIFKALDLQMSPCAYACAYSMPYKHIYIYAGAYVNMYAWVALEIQPKSYAIDKENAFYFNGIEEIV